MNDNKIGQNAFDISWVWVMGNGKYFCFVDGEYIFLIYLRGHSNSISNYPERTKQMEQ